MGRGKIFLSKKKFFENFFLKKQFFRCFFIQSDFSALSRRKSGILIPTAFVALNLIFQMQKTPYRNSNQKKSYELRRKTCLANFSGFWDQGSILRKLGVFFAANFFSTVFGSHLAWKTFFYQKTHKIFIFSKKKIFKKKIFFCKIQINFSALSSPKSGVLTRTAFVALSLIFQMRLVPSKNSNHRRS